MAEKNPLLTRPPSTETQVSPGTQIGRPAGRAAPASFVRPPWRGRDNTAQDADLEDSLTQMASEPLRDGDLA
jgi:hypothetical protein